MTALTYTLIFPFISLPFLSFLVPFLLAFPVPIHTQVPTPPSLVTPLSLFIGSLHPLPFLNLSEFYLFSPFLPTSPTLSSLLLDLCPLFLSTCLLLSLPYLIPITFISLISLPLPSFSLPISFQSERDKEERKHKY